MSKNQQSEEIKLRETYAKCVRLSEDKSTTPGEREAARKKAAEIKIKLHREKSEDHAGNLAGDTVEYKELVKQGRAAVKQQDDANWKLGELASKVESKYGEGKLEQYAANIGFPLSTLQHCERTFVAWQKLPRGSISYSAAKTLSARNIPEEKRREIITKNPTITAREAEEIAREYARKKREENQTEKRAKANGKDTTNNKKNPAHPIKGGVSTLVGIVDSTLEKGGNVQQHVAELGQISDEERKLVLAALWGLRDRVDVIIKKFTSAA